MNDQEAIRKGVELCPGYEIHDDRELRVLTNYGTFYVDYDEPFFLAALAADLVDMVDRLTDYRFQSMKECSVVNFIRSEGYGTEVSGAIGTDRRMNAIHACVAFFEKHPELAVQEDEG